MTPYSRIPTRAVIGTALSCLALGAFAIAPAAAETLSFTSDTRNQLDWFKPSIPFPGTTSPSSWTPGGTVRPFAALNFRVRSTGTYTLSAFSGGPAPVGDPTIFLYRSAFDPRQPFNNALLGNDDAVGLNSQIVTTIGAGENHTFVITAFGNVRGTNLASIAGPGGIVLSDAEIATSAQTAAINVSRLFMGSIQRQIWFARGAAFGATPSMAGGERVQLASAAQVAQGTPAPYSRPPSPYPLIGLGTYVWLTGFGGDSLIRHDEKTGGTRVRATTFGGAIGIDTRITETIIGGVAFSVGGSRSRITELSATSDQTAYQVMAYGSWSGTPWYVDGMLGYGYNTFNLSRSFPGLPEVESSPHSHQIMGYVEAGYRFPFGRFSLIPYAGIQWTAVFQRGYDEVTDGTGWIPLSVEGHSFVSARSLVGGRVTATFTLDGIPILSPLQIKPSAYAAWAFEFAGRDRVVFASISGAPNFVSRVDGARPDQHSAVFGGTLDIAVRPSFTVFVGYDGQLGSRTSSHAGTGGLKIRF
jgi:uncharacterized protein with beta-barrel porin domain